MKCHSLTWFLDHCFLNSLWAGFPGFLSSLKQEEKGRYWISCCVPASPPALSDGSRRARGGAVAKTSSTPKLLVRAATR